MPVVMTYDWRNRSWGPASGGETQRLERALQGAGAVTAWLAPAKALAAGLAEAAPPDSNAAGWANLFSAVLNIADYACVFGIMFCGALWMTGKRSEAIERFIGVGMGYLIIRKAWGIMGFLRSL